VPGFAVSNAEQYLTKRVAEFEPDVIIVYEATNDLAGNSYDVARSLGLVARRTEQSLSWLSQYSLLWYLVEKNLLVLRLQSQTDEPTGKLQLTPETMASVVAPFRRDLTALVRSSQSVAPLVVIITFAPRIRAEQTPEEQRAAAVTSLYYMPYMTVPGLIEAFAAYNETIASVAMNSNALLIAQDATIPGDADHYVDSVHFTDRRAMARRVLDGLIGSARLHELFAARAE
jgi:hypothetical protein